MQRVDIERKRTTLWPWAAGLAVLVVIVWGVTTLLAAPHGDDERITAPTAEDTLPPAAIPAPPNPVTASAPQTVADLATLGEEQVGQVIRTDGEVVATGATGFWLLAGTAVLRVDSERSVREGQTLTLEATVAQAGAERTDQIMSDVMDRHPGSGSWQVVRSVKLIDRHQAERTGE